MGTGKSSGLENNWKGIKNKAESLDKHKLCSEGLSVLYGNDKVTKMSGSGYLCGEMKNRNK